MRKLLSILAMASGLSAQQTIPGLEVYGQRVVQNSAITSGGYMVFSPITYHPYDSPTPCLDRYGNQVQQPMPTPGTPQFGANDLVLWNSLSPSMPSAGCGEPLPVNLIYGLNTNGYLFARGGLATDQSYYNSIQSLTGGVIAGSFTAGIYYPAGTRTASGVLGVGAYLGGHMDTGHSVGPPGCGNDISTCNNPFTGGEGLVAGMIYYDDALHCERAYSGSSWGCISSPGGANTDVQFNDGGVFGGVSQFTYAKTTGVLQVCATLGGVCTVTSGIQSQVFSSSATGTAVGFTDAGGNFTITGAGNAAFQSAAVNYDTFVGQASAPSVSTSGNANLYYNSTTNEFYTSYSGGGYTGLLAPIFNGVITGLGGVGPLAAKTFQNSDGSFTIDYQGNAAFQTVESTTIFNSLATGTNIAFQTSSLYAWNGQGDIGVRTATIGNLGSAVTGVSGFAILSATTAGLFASVNGGTPVNLITGGVAGSNTQIQYNSSGAFGASSNLVWDNSMEILTITGATTSGVQAPLFSSSNTGTAGAFIANNGAAEIFGNGTSQFQTVAATTTFNSLADDSLRCSCTPSITTAFQTSGGNVQIFGDGHITAQAMALTNGLTVDSGAYYFSGSGILSAYFVTTGTLTSGAATFSSSSTFPVTATSSGGSAAFYGSGPTGYVIEGMTGGTRSLALFDSGGYCYLGSTVGALCASDARLKKNVVNIAGGLGKILALRPVEYDMTGSGEHSAGVIAQEMQKILPVPVHLDSKTGYLGVSYQQIIPYLINAVQEQQVQIEQLKKEITK